MAAEKGEKVEGEEEENVEEEKGEKGVEVGEEVEKVAVGIKHGCYPRYLGNWGRHAQRSCSQLLSHQSKKPSLPIETFHHPRLHTGQ